MKLKMVGLWNLLGSEDWMLITPRKVVGQVPESGKNTAVMRKIGEVLARREESEKKS